MGPPSVERRQFDVATTIVKYFDARGMKEGDGEHYVTSYLLHTDFLFGIFLDPEDGGDMFLQNVG
jgi:hypothetical protein